MLIDSPGTFLYTAEVVNAIRLGLTLLMAACPSSTLSLSRLLAWFSQHLYNQVAGLWFGWPDWLDCQAENVAVNCSYSTGRPVTSGVLYWDLSCLVP